MRRVHLKSQPTLRRLELEMVFRFNCFSLYRLDISFPPCPHGGLHCTGVVANGVLSHHLRSRVLTSYDDLSYMIQDMYHIYKKGHITLASIDDELFQTECSEGFQSSKRRYTRYWREHAYIIPKNKNFIHRVHTSVTTARAHHSISLTS